MTETNTNGHKRISPKWLHPDQFEYLKNITEKEHITETAIINQALKLHEKVSIENDHIITVSKSRSKGRIERDGL